jgi:hypothetical protein
MPKPFTPSFKDFQKDIERYLKSEGKYEKNEHGQEVFRGYSAAVSLMFQLYMNEEAFVPLVADFRKWNWEWSYNDFLLTLTAKLQETQNWPCLKELWTAVIAKRKSNYNITRKFQKSLPEKIPKGTLQKTRELLLESLKRFEAYAAELGQESDIAEYLDMMERVQKGEKA